MPLDAGVVDTVINSNFKVVAEGPTAGASLAQHLAAIDAVDRQRTLGVISNAAIMESLLSKAGTDIQEAVANSKIARSDIGEVNTQLNAIVAMIQQMMKGAQSTPPPTG